MILGGGPNRIGQGIEFDYCCVHAALALREAGFETIMVNCNPETVSTDYDTSDRLYFEPLTFEDVMEIVELEKPEGVIVQYGGQTPLKLARALERAGAPIIGTSPDSIDLAEDRERFQQLLQRLDLKQPPNCTARTEDEAVSMAGEVGFPLVVRPSYVLGGRAMEIVHSEDDLRAYMTARSKCRTTARCCWIVSWTRPSRWTSTASATVKQVVIGGIMEHVEQAGVHSGDSACSLPPATLPVESQEEITRQVIAMARALDVKGLMNTQFAIQNGVIYVLEVNPRASRTVPVRVEGDRQAAGQDRRARDGRHQPGRAGRWCRQAAPDLLLGEGVRIPVWQVPERRPDSRPGDEIDRRGHGFRALVRGSLCEGPACRRVPGCRDAARRCCRFVTVTSRGR